MILSLEEDLENLELFKLAFREVVRKHPSNDYNFIMAETIIEYRTQLELKNRQVQRLSQIDGPKLSVVQSH